MPDRGKFIVIEGPHGVGKSEIARRMFARFASRIGPGCILTREPTDGPIGVLIRQALRREIDLAPTAMAPLYAADRLEHVATVIEPALALGEVVICDRYELSNLVYRAAEQPSVRCPRCGWESYERPFPTCRECRCDVPTFPRHDALTYARALSRGITRPDLTVVLTAPLDVCAARRRARGGKVELFDDDAIQARVHGLYERAAELLPGERVAMVDASGGAEEVESRVWAVLEEVLGG